MPEMTLTEIKELIVETVSDTVNDKLNEEVEQALKSAMEKLREEDTKVPDAKTNQDEGFKTINEYFRSVRDASASGYKVIDKRLVKAASEGTDSAGGFLVPSQFYPELLKIDLEDAIVRPNARVIPMATDSMPIPRVIDTSHSSSLFGGVIGYWTAEAGTLNETSPAFGQLELIPKKLTGYTYASNELLADSAIGVNTFLLDILREALVWYEEEAFFNGNGGTQPLGITGAPCVVSVSGETGQDASTIKPINLAKMYAQMLPRSQKRAVWVANNAVLPQLITLGQEVGTGGNIVWIGQNKGMTEAPPVTILGRPVYFTEHLPTLGSANQIMFCDFSYYLIGDRMSLSVEASPHPRFQYDQTVWRFIQRVDGKPWPASSITPKNGNALSPFVSLAAIT